MRIEPTIFRMLFLILFLTGNTVFAQEAKKPAEEKTAENKSDGDSAGPADFDALSKQLTNSTFEGHFTIDGKDTPPNKEQYFLRTVKKLAGETWLIQTRIKYGDHDVTVPLALPIKWSGKTPVITVDNVTIPGLGTFNARVLIADGKYAGTWQHGKVGGHLYGTIKPSDETTSKTNDANPSSETKDNSDK